MKNEGGFHPVVVARHKLVNDDCTMFPENATGLPVNGIEQSCDSMSFPAQLGAEQSQQFKSELGDFAAQTRVRLQILSELLMQCQNEQQATRQISHEIVEQSEVQLFQEVESEFRPATEIDPELPTTNFVEVESPVETAIDTESRPKNAIATDASPAGSSEPASPVEQQIGPAPEMGRTNDDADPMERLKAIKNRLAKQMKNA